MKQILLPKKIIKATGIENVNALKIKRPLQTILRGDKDFVDGLAKVNGPATLILDFGKEMHGGIRIITGRENGKTGTGSIVRVRFGESVSETCAELGEKGACNDHSPRDFHFTLVRLSDNRIGQTGFRFVRLDFPEDASYCIQNIYCENEILHKKAIYTYKGSDKRIKQIFDTAKRTVDLCASSGFVWDGIKRDRLVWIGDMHPEMMSLATMYGRIPEIENSLDFVRDQTPLPSWMNSFPSYSMWWIIIIADYYKYTCCDNYIKAQLDYMYNLIKQVDNFVDEEGHTHYPFNFVDWPTRGSDEEYEGTRAITIIAVKRAIEVFTKFGVDASVAENVLDRLLKLPIKCGDKKQIIGLKYLALGEISDDEYAKLIEGGAKGMSTFMSYYILNAIASRDVDKAVEIMKEYYGAMLDVGATSFWEDFNIEWTKGSSRIDRLPKRNEKDIHGDFGAFCYLGFRHSFCHGWSSGVIRFIKENC